MDTATIASLVLNMLVSIRLWTWDGRKLDCIGFLHFGLVIGIPNTETTPKKLLHTSNITVVLSGSSPPPPSPPPGAFLLSVSLSLSSCEQSALMMVKAVGMDHCSLSHFPHFRCHSPHLHHRAHHLRHQVDCRCWGPMGLSVRIPIKHGTP